VSAGANTTSSTRPAEVVFHYGLGLDPWAAMTAAPIWQKPTPWPQPAPRRVNRAGTPAAPPSVRTTKALLYKCDGLSQRLISSSLPTTTVRRDPAIRNRTMRPDGPAGAAPAPESPRSQCPTA